jgi:hypothetical protein
VKVKDVDVVGLELLQRVPDGHVKGLLGVSRRVDGLVLALGVASVARLYRSNARKIGQLGSDRRMRGRAYSIFGSDDHSVSVLASFHPLSDPGLRLLVL